MPRKRAPVQKFSGGIPWELHLKAYEAYSTRWSPQQALIEGGCRGGFGISELDMLVPDWRAQMKKMDDEERDDLLQQDNDRLRQALRWALPLAEAALENHRLERLRCGHDDITGTYKSGATWVGIWQTEVDEIEFAREALRNGS